MKLSALYVMSIIFAVLLFSRALAVSSEALSPDPAAGLEEPSPAYAAEKGSGTVDAASTAQCLTGDVLGVLKADQAKLSEKLAAVEAREQTLATLEVKLSAQMTQIEAANTALEERIAVMKNLADDDISHLVKMYQAMKPKQAAEIFNSMDPAFAAGFLREMSGERAGFIMANMDSRKSYAISVIMASKNAKYR